MMKSTIKNAIKANLLENAPVIIAYYDLDYNIIWGNKAYQQATGASLREIEGKKCFSVWDFSMPCRNCPITKVIETGEPAEAKLTFPNQKHWTAMKGSWLLKAAPIRDAEGSIIGIIETAYDITECNQTENISIPSIDLSYKLLDHLIEGCQVISFDWKYLYLNNAVVMQSCQSKERLLGQSMMKAYPGIENTPVFSFIRQCMEERSSHQMENEFTFPDGSKRWFELRIDPVSEGVFILSIDITERKRAEEQNEKLQVQLAQAQKMESVGRLAGGVAHDFNNILNVILGYTEIAMDRINPTESLYADLMKIFKAAERASNLTRQLLTFARRQTVLPKVLNLNKIVEGMFRILRRLIGENIELIWLPRTGLWQVKLDPSQVDQILANLCINARDAIADIGKITIKTENALIDEAYCTDHTRFVPGEYVLLAISDNGCGMDKEILDQVFEPFFTTKGIEHGTGLGLATVYGIVKQNKGFINVYSEPGKGTTFKIYLPRHTGKNEETQIKFREQVYKGGNETLLVVEDDVSILNLIRIMLDKLGYQVLIAKTAGEALQLVKEYTSEIHLLITDVVMPEMNGRDLAAKLKTLHPGLKTLFMSGYTANIIAHHGVLEEGVQFINKPFSSRDLAAKVREALLQK